MAVEKSHPQGTHRSLLRGEWIRRKEGAGNVESQLGMIKIGNMLTG